MLTIKYFHCVDLDKASKIEVGAHDVGAPGCPNGKSWRRTGSVSLRPPGHIQLIEKRLTGMP